MLWCSASELGQKYATQNYPSQGTPICKLHGPSTKPSHMWSETGFMWKGIQGKDERFSCFFAHKLFEVGVTLPPPPPPAESPIPVRAGSVPRLLILMSACKKSPRFWLFTWSRSLLHSHPLQARIPIRPGQIWHWISHRIFQRDLSQLWQIIAGWIYQVRIEKKASWENENHDLQWKCRSVHLLPFHSTFWLLLRRLFLFIH